jgi:hypothetical protein
MGLQDVLFRAWQTGFPVLFHKENLRSLVSIAKHFSPVTGQ